MLDADDSATWNEILAALPPRLRRALVGRLIAAHAPRLPSPPPAAWRVRRARLAERDETLRAVAQWAMPGLPQRDQARILRQWLARAVGRREPFDDPAGRIVSLNSNRGLSAGSIRRVLAQKN